MEQKKLSVHICSGCEIGDSVDVEALSQIPESSECSIHPCLCSEEGVNSLKSAINNGAGPLVIAACSPRYKTDEFSFDGCFVERVNLRELVVWSHEPNDEDTQMMAEDYLRMGLIRAEKAALPEPFEIPINKTIMVVGGGTTGIEAATQAARAGYEVILVEKKGELGGWRQKYSKVFPDKPPYEELTDAGLGPEIAGIEANEKITLHTSSEITSITGQPGQFDVDIRRNGDVNRVTVGAIIQATGWEPYDANRLTHLNYSDSPDVVTNVEMEELLSQDGLRRPSDGKPVKTVAFVQCAGSRDKEHLPYCSTVCCRVTMKQALHARELNPELQALVFYKDIRTPGQYEDLYRRAQEDGGILFTKGDVQSVNGTSAGLLHLDVSDTLLGAKIKVEADLVVLATGMVPVSADGEAIRNFDDAQAIIEKRETGAKLEAAQKTVAELEPYVSDSILNLDYRQGPDTPILRHRFPDSHFICFPYETRRTGIYHAGAVRAPSDTGSSRADAAGAVLKAIQTVELAAQGKAVHPRWEDMSYPDFSFQRCTQCKRCTEECPFGVLNEDEKGTPQPNPTRCRRCGICLGACPERVISFKDYSIDIVSSMIKAVEIPEEWDEKPRLLGLICENDAYPALDTAGLKRLKHSAYIRFIPVRCLGSVNIVWIADALSRGYDGILLIGCKSGDNYQCHFIRGSELMKTRSSNVREKLKQLALEEERVRIEELSIAEPDRIAEIINSFEEEIEEIGLNPFKGF
jgi:quinone-modifying oxidoreductase subunit QmoB